MNIGCRFCGQLVMVEPKDILREGVDDIRLMDGWNSEAYNAAMHCDCPDAKFFQKQEDRRVKITEKIEHELYEGEKVSSKVKEILKTAVIPVMEYGIDSICVTTAGSKTTMKLNSKGLLELKKKKTVEKTLSE